jgi:hypothetical protein
MKSDRTIDQRAVGRSHQQHIRMLPLLVIRRRTVVTFSYLVRSQRLMTLALSTYVEYTNRTHTVN